MAGSAIGALSIVSSKPQPERTWRDNRALLAWTLLGERFPRECFYADALAPIRATIGYRAISRPDLRIRDVAIDGRPHLREIQILFGKFQVRLAGHRRVGGRRRADALRPLYGRMDVDEIEAALLLPFPGQPQPDEAQPALAAAGLVSINAVSPRPVGPRNGRDGN